MSIRSKLLGRIQAAFQHVSDRWVIQRASGVQARRRRWLAGVARIEGLECRQLLSSVAWIGAGDGSHWSDAANWSPHIPGPSDDVTIDLAGNPSISFDTITASIGSLVCTDPLTISSGSLTITGTGAIKASQATGAFTLSGGSLIIDGTLNPTLDTQFTTDSVTITGGQLNVTGPGTSFTATGALPSPMRFAGVTASNRATVLFSQASNLQFVSMHASSGATISFPQITTYTVSVGEVVQASGTGSVIDLHNLTTLSGGSQIQISALNSGEVRLGGSIGSAVLNVDSGTLTVTNVTNLNGVTLNASNGSDVLFPRASSLQTVNLYANSGATIRFPVATTYGSTGGDVVQASGFSTVNGTASLIDLHSLTTLTGGASQTHINVLNGGIARLGGSISRAILTVDSSLSTLDVSNVSSLTNATVTASVGAAVDLASATVLTFTSLYANSGAMFTLPQIATYTVSGTDVVQVTGASSSIDLSHLSTLGGNGGQIQITVANGGELLLGGSVARAAITLNNAGTLRVPAGVALTWNGIASITTQGAGNQMLNQGTFSTDNVTVTLTNAALNNQSGGTVYGSDIGGTFTGDLINNGLVSPGGPNAPGNLTIHGNYTQAATATLRIDLGGLSAGSQYDQLNVAGLATLAGTEDIYLLGAYMPTVGYIFNTVQAIAFSGGFDSSDGTSLGGGIALKLESNISQQMLRVTPAPLDTGTPTAAWAVVGTPVTGVTAIDFTVRYADDTAILLSSIDSNDVIVTGGQVAFSQTAQLLSTTKANNGTPRTATYRITNPAGFAGTYAFAMKSNAVTDTVVPGKPVPAGNIGSITLVIPTTTVVSSALNPAVYGQSVTLTATVSSQYRTPVGETVQFLDGAAAIGTGTLDVNGNATLTIPAFSAGSHPITVVYAGDTNYFPSTSTPLTQTITPAALTITANDQTMVYGAALPTLTASYSGFVNGDTFASLSTPPILTTTATSSSHVSGSPYTITASGAAGGNYTISYVAGRLTVTKAALTITADSLTKVYGAAVPTLTASYTGLVNGDTAASLSKLPTLSTLANATSHTRGNPYTIAVARAASSDYTISYVPGTLTVTKAPLTITADDQTKVYGAALPTLTFSYSGFVNGDTAGNLTTLPTLTTTATAGSHVSGSPYAITVSGATSGDYAINQVAGNLTVTEATLLITADNVSKVYGAALPTLTASYSGFVNGDTSADLTLPPTLTTTATASSHVSGGPYIITALDAVDTDYAISYADGTLTVTKAPLTISADSKSKVYGAALPALTISYNGFVNGDTAGILASLPTVVTAATAHSHVSGSPYAIVVSGPASSDYAISYVAGGLTVTPAALTISADSKSKPYGGALPTLTASYIGLVNGDTAASLTTPPTLTSSATATSPASGSPYVIIAAGAASADYAISYMPGSLTVTENHPSTNLTLSADGVSENQPVGTIVGTFNTVDPDLGGTYTYSLVGSSPSSDNAKFTIVGNELRTAAIFKYTTRQSYSILVRSTDQGGLVFEKNFTVSVLPRSTIKGILFNDLNANGVRSGNEPLLAAQTVFLDANDNGSLDAGEPSQKTTSKGAYSFANLLPGNYPVRALLSTGWRASQPTYSAALEPGEILTARDLGLTRLALVTGTVFNDANGDKLRGPGESGLAGWTVFVDKDNDGVLDNTELSAKTNAAGNFSLNLAAGTYVLRVVAKPGYKVTTPAGSKMTVKVAQGQTLSGRLFGFKK